MVPELLMQLGVKGKVSLVRNQDAGVYGEMSLAGELVERDRNTGIWSADRLPYGLDVVYLGSR